MDALDAHFAAAFRILASHNPRGVTALRDGVEVTAAGAGGAPFNPAWVVGAPSSPAETVGWACDLLRGTGRPYCLHVPEPFLPALAPVLDSAGLESRGSTPGMVRPARDEEPALPEGLRLVEVRDPAELEAFAVGMATGFGSPQPRDAVDVLVPSLLDDERVVLLNGYVDGGDAPSATALGIVAEGMVGLYAVTCHEHARRRGIGAAITLAAVAAGARRGAATAALQATAMGEPVYRRIGFETVREYAFYRPC